MLRIGVEFVIYKVQDDDVSFFEEKYGDQILLQADDLMQLLLLFEQQLLFSLDYHKNDHTIFIRKGGGSAGGQLSKR